MGTFGVKRASDDYFCPSTVDTAQHIQNPIFPNFYTKLYIHQQLKWASRGNTCFPLLTKVVQTFMENGRRREDIFIMMEE